MSENEKRLPLFKVFMSPTVTQDLDPVLHSGSITQGKKVEEFEAALKNWFGYPYILTLNSATSGLTLAVRLGFPPGSEIEGTVLCSPLTCFATVASILAISLKIKWVDTDPETGNICLLDLEKKLAGDDSIKGMVFVHWGGSPLDIDRINALRYEYLSRTGTRPFLVEDCAHSFGAEYLGKKLGAHCGISESICVFSLQAIKHLTTGDGGLIFLPTEELYERAKLLRWYGIDRLARTNGKDFRLEKDIPEWGYKFHMNDISATIGLSNLGYIDQNLERVRENVDFYESQLKDLKYVQLMKAPAHTRSAHWVFTIRVKDKQDFIPFADSRGVMASQVHNRNDGHSCVAEFKADLPGTDQAEKELVCVPCGWWMADEDCQRVADVIRDWDAVLKKKYHYSIRGLDSADYFNGFLHLFLQLNGVRITLNWPEFRERLLEMEKHNNNTLVAVADKEIGPLGKVMPAKKVIATGKILIEDKFYQSVGHIEDVIVDREFRGEGVGKEIIQGLVEIGKRSDCYKVILECHNDIRNFYLKCGFRPKGSQMVRYLTDVKDGDLG